MKTLEELSLLENTILVFTSDNGGEAPNVTSNAPLRGGKSQLYEGGVRVPLIIHWPKKIKSSREVHSPTVSMDYYPTFLEVADLEHDKRQILDGQSILPQILGEEQGDRDFYWHYPLRYPHFLGGVSAGSLRSGDWKLIESFKTNSFELFNLKNDPEEKHNLANSHPEKIQEMKKKLQDWRKSLSLE